LDEVDRAPPPSEQLGDEYGVHCACLCKRHNLVPLDPIILGVDHLEATALGEGDGVALLVVAADQRSKLGSRGRPAVPIEPPAPKTLEIPANSGADLRTK
jgi:hypothetical protein